MKTFIVTFKTETQYYQLIFAGRDMLEALESARNSGKDEIVAIKLVV